METMEDRVRAGATPHPCHVVLVRKLRHLLLIRRNWKPLLLGWTLTTVLVFVAIWGNLVTSTGDAVWGWFGMVSAGLIFVALLVWTIVTKRKPLLAGLVLGIVIGIPMVIGLVYWAFSVSFSSG